MLHFIRNERGVLLPEAMLLLFVVCLSIFATTSAYVSKYQTYDSLEKSNIDAAIQKIEMQQNPL